MTKYKFTSEFTSYGENSAVTSTKEFHADSLSDVISEFREFLLGCGFGPTLVDEYLGE